MAPNTRRGGGWGFGWKPPVQVQQSTPIIPPAQTPEKSDDAGKATDAEKKDQAGWHDPNLNLHD